MDITSIQNFYPSASGSSALQSHAQKQKGIQYPVVQLQPAVMTKQKNNVVSVNYFIACFY